MEPNGHPPPAAANKASKPRASNKPKMVKKRVKIEVDPETGEEKKVKVAPTPSGPCLCPICGAQFKGKQTLKRHLDVLHQLRTKEYKCPECGKIFTRGQTLARHIQGVHAAKKEFQCHQCAKQFSLKW